MIHHKLLPILLLCSLFLLTGCEVIAGIFKAGFWTAIILVLLIIFLIGYIIYKVLD